MWWTCEWVCNFAFRKIYILCIFIISKYICENKKKTNERWSRFSIYSLMKRYTNLILVDIPWTWMMWFLINYFFFRDFFLSVFLSHLLNMSMGIKWRMMMLLHSFAFCFCFCFCFSSHSFTSFFAILHNNFKTKNDDKYISLLFFLIKQRENFA